MDRSSFSLHVGGWQDGKIYTHSYALGDAEWREEDVPLLAGSSFHVKVEGEKCAGVYRLHLWLRALLKTCCDRCGDELELPLADDFELLFRPISGDYAARNQQESDPYIWYIPLGERVLDLFTWIYDSIILLATRPKLCAQLNKACNPRVMQFFQNSP